MEHNNTKITCPICGAEFAIPEHQHVAVGTVVGKDSGLGEIHPPLASNGILPNKAADRLEALRAAGIDVTGLYALESAAGSGVLVRMEDGLPKLVGDDDIVAALISSKGYIPERRLFRRWVTAQMFRMLSDPNGYKKAIERLGFRYSWNMLEEELRVQARLHLKDPENFAMRNRWFNKDVALAMLRDYIKAVNAEIAGKKPRMHKGKPYVSVFGHNYHFNNVEANLYKPLRELEKEITKADNPKELLLCVRRFHRLCVGSVHKIPQSPAWVDAFKGAGAYFTLRNLVMFHGVLVRGCKTIDESLRAIDNKSMAKAGYKMFGMMKETLSFNNFDIRAKRSEWAQRYAQRAKALQANTAD